MSSAISQITDLLSAAAASALHCSELVRKIGTSPAAASPRRKSAARKKLARAIKEQRRYAKTANLRAVALTLTYRDATIFFKKHISIFLDKLRRILKRMGHIFPYAWVLEYSSHLHYHLILWLPRGYILDRVTLEKWWPWGSTWLAACESVGAWGRYMRKFDSLRKLPSGARLYGYGGLDNTGRMAILRAALPRWLLRVLPVGHRARRCSGRGWLDVETGEIHRSPYVWTPFGYLPCNGLPKALDELTIAAIEFPLLVANPGASTAT